MSTTTRFENSALLFAAVLLLVASGCRRDKELTQMQGEVTRAATELVIRDAQVRQQWLQVQSRLDEDRRQLAKEQRRDPIIAQAFLQVGAITLCLLPLIVIAKLLRRDEAAVVFDPADDMVFEELFGHWVPLLPCAGDPPADQPQSPRGSQPSDLNALIQQRLDDSQQ